MFNTSIGYIYAYRLCMIRTHTLLHIVSHERINRRKKVNCECVLRFPLYFYPSMEHLTYNLDFLRALTNLLPSIEELCTCTTSIEDVDEDCWNSESC